MISPRHALPRPACCLRGRKQTPGQFKKSMIQGVTSARGAYTSSAEETESDGCNTDDYTSGAITSDDELIAATRRRGGTTIPRSSFTYPVTSDEEIEETPGTRHTIVPSPGYSEGDYQHLSSMQSNTHPKRPTASAPRKRRKNVGRPGKVMKSAYFKGIQWTKLFVTSPLDPVHNKHKFYCQICKTNVSIYSKRTREKVWHYQSEAHLRKNQ